MLKNLCLSAKGQLMKIWTQIHFMYLRSRFVWFKLKLRTQFEHENAGFAGCLFFSHTVSVGFGVEKYLCLPSLVIDNILRIHLKERVYLKYCVLEINVKNWTLILLHILTTNQYSWTQRYSFIFKSQYF